MSGRYAVEGAWDLHKEITVTDGTGTVTLGYIETADLRDTRGGYLYPQGAHRVRLTSKGRKVGVKARTFKGETAWSDAERLADDVFYAARRFLIEGGEL